MKMKFLFPLLLLFCKAVWSIGPLIDGDPFQVVNSGENLTLTCHGSKHMKWLKDNEDLHTEEFDYVEIEHAAQNDSDSLFASTLTIVDVFDGERGNYTCYYNDSADFSYDKERMHSVFVFVPGEVFVRHYLNSHEVTVGETLQIDCSVTDPSFNVTLKLKSGKSITNEKERVKFDPRSGFSVKDVKLEDSGDYVCESGGSTLDQKVEVIGVDTDRLPSPSINKGENQNFVKGDKFMLKCTVLDHNVKFNWTYPNKGVKHELNSTKENQTNTIYYHSILTVSKASENDTGLYTCNISAEGFSPNSSFIHIAINERMESFLSITSGSIIKADEKSDEIKWKTTIRSYPSKPTITYTDWTGQVLNTTDRITIEYDEFEGLSWLRIKNVSDTDFGNYSVNVTVPGKEGGITKSESVKFEILSKPKMEMKGVPDYVSEGKELDVTCRARGFPNVTISLQFQNCSSSSSCESPTAIETEETKQLDPGNIFVKTAVISPKTSGLLQCMGSNPNGTDIESVFIIMSDIDGIFVLHYYGADENSTNNTFITVVENDNFTLMCGGAKFKYKKVEVVPIQQTNSHNPFQSADSEFSWRKEMEVKKATTSLSGKYMCTAYPYEDSGDTQAFKNFKITVHAEELVRFKKKANMKNQTEEVKDAKGVTLKCLVTGSPQPTIQWLKDNKDLTKEPGLFDENAMEFLSGQKELKFSHVAKKHTGVYTCIAKNRLNEVKGSFTLKIPDPGVGETAKMILAILVVGLAILFISVGFLIHRVRKEKEKSNNPFRKQGREFFETGNVESLNLTSTADKQAEMLPYDKKKWEVPRANITLGRQLGAGAFGRVIKATVTGLQGPATTTVAVKMCKNDVNELQLGAIISELKIMMYLGTHLNIVNLLGANTEHIGAGEIWILVEYCRFGNLLDFIIKQRRNFTNLISPETGEIDPNLIANSPTSPTFSDSVPPSLGVDQEGYLAPTATKAVLADPSESHSAETVPSSATVTSPSSSSSPSVTAGQFASNPMYSMNINTINENSNSESKGSEEFRTSKFLQRKPSRLMSIGSFTLSDGSSVSRLLRRPSQQSCNSPLSPTERCFMGENDPDVLYEIGSVPGFTAPFTTIDLICWGWQMAQGMNYLSRRKILHGDLAARNLLLGDNNILKISDFGLSRNMYRNDNYVKKGDDLLPVKWMSIEAIRDKIFSIESDVWAFGITLWEIFSLGCSPYAGVEVSHDFLEKLENGHRMSCPKYGNEEIYKIMRLCWEEDPLERPSFSQLVDDLGTMISDHTEKYESQNEEYMQMNTERFKEETDYLSMMAKPTFENWTKPDEIEVEHYLPMTDSTRNSSIRIELPDAAAYSHGRSSQVSSPATTADYLPMSAAKTQSPSDDVFSTPSTEPSRFTFPPSNPERPRLASLVEEEGSTSPEREEPHENSTLLATKKQPPSDENLSNESRNKLPVEAKNSINNYVNI